MGTEDAIEIMRALANGQNSENGGVLQAGDLCLSAESVYRTVPAILARLMKLGKISPVSAQLA